MKFGHSEVPPQSGAERAIAMIRASESLVIHEMASLLVSTHTGATIETEAIETSCERVAGMAEEVGVCPDDMQILLGERNVIPIPEEADWPTLLGALKALESQTD